MKSRLVYLGKLKVVLVVGVIAVHAAITYGLGGSWYLESYDKMSAALVDVVTVVLGTGWLFGLGLFFLIAGRLSGPALDRKGPSRFAHDRLIRLGVPLVAYTLLVSPFLEYVDYRFNGQGRQALLPFLGDQVWHFAPGPTWFLEALLVFSLGYAMWRALGPESKPPSRDPLRGWQVAAVALGIAGSSFAVRFAFPTTRRVSRASGHPSRTRLVARIAGPGADAAGQDSGLGAAGSGHDGHGRTEPVG